MFFTSLVFQSLEFFPFSSLQVLLRLLEEILWISSLKAGLTWVKDYTAGAHMQDLQETQQTKLQLSKGGRDQYRGEILL